MEAKLLHHLGVPCIAQIKPSAAAPIVDEKEYYVNPQAVIRYEPNGATITPPHLYSSFIHVDLEMSDCLRTGLIHTGRVPAESLKLLKENLVLLGDRQDSLKLRQMSVEIDNLPAQVLLDVTSSCNCDCITCYHKSDLSGSTPDIGTVLNRVEHLHRLGISLFEVTGGEPLLRTDLSEILCMISELGGLYYVVSNGEYLSAASDELLGTLANGLGLAVSLDGVAEVHDQVRRRDGLYDKLIKGLEKAAGYGVKTYLVSTLNDNNIHCVPQMIDVAKRFNTTVHLRPTIHTGAAVTNRLKEISLLGEITPFLDHPNVRNGLLSTKKSIPQAKSYGCGIRKRISVSVDGNLFPCVMDRDRKGLTVESCDAKMLVDILERETRQILESHAVCRECSVNIEAHRIVCGGFCRFSKSYEKGII